MMTEYSYNAVLYYMQNAILYQTNNMPDSMPRRLYKSQSVLKEKSAFSFLRQLSTRHCPHVLLSAVLRPSAATLRLPVNICGPVLLRCYCQSISAAHTALSNIADTEDTQTDRCSTM